MASLLCLGNSTQDPKEACDSVSLQTRWLSEQACHGDAGDAKGMGFQASVCRELAREQSPGIHMLPSLPLPIQPSLKARTEGAEGRAAAGGLFCLRSCIRWDPPQLSGEKNNTASVRCAAWTWSKTIFK